jgi:hypothetical protein
LPVGIEDIPAEWGKIITLVQDTITQVRSDLKKDVRFLILCWLPLIIVPCATQLLKSVRVVRNKVVCDLKPQDHQNLYSLAQTIVSGTNVRISKALCGRIALMVYMLYLLLSFTSDESHSARCISKSTTLATGTHWTQH